MLMIGRDSWRARSSWQKVSGWAALVRAYLSENLPQGCQRVADDHARALRQDKKRIDLQFRYLIL